MVEEGLDVTSHRIARVRLGVVRLRREAVAPGVERDDTPALVDE